MCARVVAGVHACLDKESQSETVSGVVHELRRTRDTGAPLWPTYADRYTARTPLCTRAQYASSLCGWCALRGGGGRLGL